MLRHSVDSSMIASLAYDPGTRVLEIEFKAKKNQQTGAVYEYAEVPKEAVDKLLHAQSLGSFFAAHIRDRFQWKRISDPVEKPEEK